MVDPNNSIVGIIQNGEIGIFLLPFSGLGEMFLPGQHPILTSIFQINNFSSFMTFLLQNYLVFCIILNLIMAYITGDKFLKEFFVLTLLSIATNLFGYLILSQVNFLDEKNAYLYSIQPIHILLGLQLFGITLYLLSRVLMIKKSSVKSELETVLFGLIFAQTFIAGTWLVVNKGLHLFGAYGAINRYYQFASVGVIITISGIIYTMLRRASHSTFSKIVFQIIITCFFLFYLLASKSEIEFGFGQINKQDSFLLRNSQLQSSLQERFTKELNLDLLNNNEAVLFYFESPRYEKNLFERSLDLFNMPTWLHLKLGLTTTKCYEVISNPDQLKLNKKIIAGKIELIPINPVCISPGYKKFAQFKSNIPLSYRAENIFAYRYANGHFLDIKETLLQEINQ